MLKIEQGITNGGEATKILDVQAWGDKIAFKFDPEKVFKEAPCYLILSGLIEDFEILLKFAKDFKSLGGNANEPI